MNRRKTLPVDKTFPVFSTGLVLCIFLVLMACKAPPPREILAMGTLCRINLFDDGSSKLYNRLFDRIIALDNKFSVNVATSEISKINDCAGKSAVKVSDETFFVVKAALEAAHATDGAFNPLILPLTRLWDVLGSNPRVPTNEEISEAQSHCDFRKVILDEANGTIFLEDEKSALDIGGIVKGYVCDELEKILVEERVSRAILDLGGNIFIFGKNSPDTQEWRVGIKNPFGENHAAIVVSLEDGAVVTSGDYERFFEKNGQIFHHIIDWKTGYPAISELKSVTILSKSAMVADILSTTLFVLGWEDGLKLIENRDDIKALAITKDRKTLVTKNLETKIVKNEFR